MKRPLLFASVAVFLLSFNSCVIFQAARAVQGIQEALTAESDFGLAAGALPTLIKVQEGLLAASPEDQGTIVGTAQLYIMYGNAFVQGPAQDLPSREFEKKRSEDLRARNLYRRAFVLLEPALNRKAPGIVETFRKGQTDKDGLPAGAKAMLARFGKADVAMMYWSAASILAAFSIDPLDMRESSIVSLAKAFLDRGLELDPAYDNGTLQDLAVSVYGSFPPELGGDKARAESAFRKGMEITGGRSPGLYVTYAATICVPNDDYAGFKKNLDAALAIDPEANPKSRLMTLITQNSARRMLAHAEDYFLSIPGDGAVPDPSNQ